jgi:hypothetical protein
MTKQEPSPGYTPPSDPEAERAVLGAILVRPAAAIPGKSAQAGTGEDPGSGL